MLKVGRNLILLLVALLAFAALVTTAFAPGEFALTRDDEVVRRNDDSSDVYGVSDDDDDGLGNPPTNDTGSDFNTNGKWSNGTLSDHSTAW
ncbi:MAG: hypothetical protein ACRDKF_06750 [Actinomycetota bacterium]